MQVTAHEIHYYLFRDNEGIQFAIMIDQYCSIYEVRGPRKIKYITSYLHHQSSKDFKGSPNQIEVLENFGRGFPIRIKMQSQKDLEWLYPLLVSLPYELEPLKKILEEINAENAKPN